MAASASAGTLAVLSFGWHLRLALWQMFLHAGKLRFITSNLSRSVVLLKQQIHSPPYLSFWRHFFVKKDSKGREKTT